MDAVARYFARPHDGPAWVADAPPARSWPAPGDIDALTRCNRSPARPPPLAHPRRPADPACRWVGGPEPGIDYDEIIDLDEPDEPAAGPTSQTFGPAEWAARLASAGGWPAEPKRTRRRRRSVDPLGETASEAMARELPREEDLALRDRCFDDIDEDELSPSERCYADHGEPTKQSRRVRLRFPKWRDLSRAARLPDDPKEEVWTYEISRFRARGWRDRDDLMQEILVIALIVQKQIAPAMAERLAGEGFTRAAVEGFKSARRYAKNNDIGFKVMKSYAMALAEKGAAFDRKTVKKIANTIRKRWARQKKKARERSADVENVPAVHHHHEIDTDAIAHALGVRPRIRPVVDLKAQGLSTREAMRLLGWADDDATRRRFDRDLAATRAALVGEGFRPSRHVQFAKKLPPGAWTPTPLPKLSKLLREFYERWQADLAWAKAAYGLFAPRPAAPARPNRPGHRRKNLRRKPLADKRLRV